MKRVTVHDVAAEAKVSLATVDRVLNGRPGVKAATIERVNKAIKRLAERGVIPITLVSDIPNSMRAHFVGIDHIAAGRTAASLLGRFIKPNKGKVAVVAGSMLLRDHVDRRFGFEQVISSEYQGIEVLPVCEGLDDNKMTQSLVEALLKTHPDLIGIYNVGAAKRGLISALKAHNT